jgi:hypothetical protein
MVVGRALRATGCAGCRLNLIRSFASLANPSIRLQQPPNRPHTSRRSQQLRYSSQGPHYATSLGTSTHDDNSKVVEKEKEDEFDEDIEDTQAVEGTQVSSVPWYLQVDSPQRAPMPISERQRIPDLPGHAPPILAPLIQQVSVDLGLDDLTLLDLRGLDPPPALGANLLMLIGTARSEKHLHVSADRLCRWLRSTYKLKPDADGLLGRNELKLKLKRKAKRAKLMGSAADDNNDDGVRTGWVCVDIGVVPSAEGMPEPAPVPKDFVGFGRRTDDVRIVVQMLTEEKRADINLEKLWTGILERGTPKEVEDETAGDDGQPDHYFPVSANHSNQSTISTAGQSREYHTTARRLNPSNILALDPVLQSHIDPTTANSFEAFDLQSIEDAAMQDLASGDYEKARNRVLQYSNSIPQLQNESWRPFLLRLLNLHLQSLPETKALEMLGNGDSDRTSTPFLLCFYETLSPIYHSPSEVEMVIWLHGFAQERGHPGYEYLKLINIFAEARAAGVKMSTASYRRLLHFILRTNSYFGPSHPVLIASLGIIQTMHDQGFDILSEDILVRLQECTMPPLFEDVSQHKIHTDPEETFDLPSIPMAPISRRFHSIMVQLDLPFFRDNSRMRLMELYADRQHWQEFWDIFKMAPRQNKPQSASMYAFMLFHVAQTKHQKACMAVLRTWSVDLQREDPSIELKGDISEALKACLLIADPHVQQNTLDPEAKGEWISLWRKCL